LRELEAIRGERFELMAELAKLPSDMVFYTQITMEAAEDAEFLSAMRRARIRGALVGVESVTPEGLKAVYKNFNEAGDALVGRLQAFRSAGIHVLGSFIFGLPTDTPDTFAATVDLAQRANLSFAQFVMLTPFPGTVDFAAWEHKTADGPTIEGVPLTRYWLIPAAKRPRVYSPHPSMSWGPSGGVRRVCILSGHDSRSCSYRSCTGRCTRILASPLIALASPVRRGEPDGWPRQHADCSLQRRCPTFRNHPGAGASKAASGLL
jgi:hypothetical protein